jgi:lysophospholipase L1-like esterase
VKQNLKSRKDVMLPSEKQNALAGHTRSKEFTMPVKWIRLATLGLGLLWTYFLLVFFYADSILGVSIRFRYLALTIVASFGGIHWLGHWLYRRQLVSETRLKDLAVVSIAVLVSILAADIGYSVYFGAVNLASAADYSQDYYRWTDPQLGIEESQPRTYYPTEKNFTIYKPNVTMGNDTYGDSYYRRLTECPTVFNSVPELRHVSYSIDEHGFRETTPLEQAHIFALGDSFTFGYGVDQDKTWVELLEQAIGEPTYNLGVTDHSPKQQLMLLEYMLQTKPDSIKVRRLLWMICEANDLEDSYETLHPVPAQIQEKDSFENLFAGTIVGTLNSIPFTVKQQSVINRLRTGQITLALPSKDTDRPDPYLVDGIRLLYPLYHSTQFGYRPFQPLYLERARENQSYVLDHPNRRLLDQTFKDMASLSRKHGFKVTVLIAPGAPRLYAPYFEDFPPISEQPYFINYVEELSNGQGFDVINLYPPMQPYAREELLYWRDDSHWNERGNEVAAEIIAEHLVDHIAAPDNSLKTNPNLDGFRSQNRCSLQFWRVLHYHR